LTLLKVLKIPHQDNSLVIRQEDGKEVFLANKDTLIITTPNLAYLIKFLVFRELLSTKVLQGIIDEYYSYKQGE
jgi:hypothetical protein